MLDLFEDGLCHGEKQDRWFPERSNSTCIEPAKAVCRACPVQSDCLDYALTTRLPDGRPFDGIWGGTTEDERIRIRFMTGGRPLSDFREAASG